MLRLGIICLATLLAAASNATPRVVLGEYVTNSG
jgi:hypothetical protein